MKIKFKSDFTCFYPTNSTIYANTNKIIHSPKKALIRSTTRTFNYTRIQHYPQCRRLVCCFPCYNAHIISCCIVIHSIISSFIELECFRFQTSLRIHPYSFPFTGTYIYLHSPFNITIYVSQP